MTIKISSDQVQAALAEVPEAIRKLASERDFWREKAVSLMREDEIAKVASEIQARGLDNGQDVEELLGGLRKAASHGKLDTIREALEWAGPNMGEKVASLGDRPGNHGVSAMDRLNAAVLE